MAERPTTEPAVPPGDFSTGSFFTSPSTYLTLATYFIPVANVLLERDVTDVALAAANLAPVLATIVLVAMRSRGHKVVTDANLQLALARIGTPRDGFHEERLDEVELHLTTLQSRVEEDERRLAQVEHREEQYVGRLAALERVRDAEVELLSSLEQYGEVSTAAPSFDNGPDDEPDDDESFTSVRVDPSTTAEFPAVEPAPAPAPRKRAPRKTTGSRPTPSGRRRVAP